MWKKLAVPVTTALTLAVMLVSAGTASPGDAITTQATPAPEPITTCASYTGPTYDGLVCVSNGNWTKEFTLSDPDPGAVCDWRATVQWGDGTSDSVSSGDAPLPSVSHTYRKPGFAYHAIITGSGGPECQFVNTHRIIAVPAVQSDPPDGTTASGQSYWKVVGAKIYFPEGTNVQPSVDVTGPVNTDMTTAPVTIGGDNY